MEGTYDYVEDEVVGISWRRSKHDDQGHDPVLEQPGERGVEGFVGSEEARERQNPFTSEFLHDPALGEDHGQNVSKSGECDEDGKRAFRLLAKDVAEEGGRKDTARGDYLVFGHGREIGDVCEHVQDADEDESGRGGNPEGTDGVAGFG